MAEEFVYSVQSTHDIYNRNTQVLKRRVARVKESIASPSEEILKDPHVKFFIEQNSDWQKVYICLPLSLDIPCLRGRAWKQGNYFNGWQYDLLLKKSFGAAEKKAGQHGIRLGLLTTSLSVCL